MPKAKPRAKPPFVGTGLPVELRSLGHQYVTLKYIWQRKEGKAWPQSGITGR